MPIINDIKNLHQRSSATPAICRECSRIYPCRTRQLLDDAGLISVQFGSAPAQPAVLPDDMEPTPEGVADWLNERLAEQGLPPVTMVLVIPPDEEPEPEPAAASSDPDLIAKLMVTSPHLWDVARQHAHGIDYAGCECLGVMALRQFDKQGWLNDEGKAMLNVFTSWPV